METFVRRSLWFVVAERGVESITYVVSAPSWDHARAEVEAELRYGWRVRDPRERLERRR